MGGVNEVDGGHKGPPLLSGWGRIAAPGREVLSEDLAAVARSRPLTRGLGRSYGDSSLPPPGHLEVAGSGLADRILAFDKDNGLLRAEAGFSLAELIRLFLPRGFWCPSSPGTQFVTLGGMVAADVHGKSHHIDGTFGRHVTALTLLLADGRLVRCSRQLEPELFFATLGGMGLTGHILEVEVLLQRVPSPWIEVESERIDGLPRFIDKLRLAAMDWPYTVGWIDCLARGRNMGRGILTRGRWAAAALAPPRLPSSKALPAVPFVFPGFVLSRPTVRLFNEVYYRAHWRRVRRNVVDPFQFFYPLDVLPHWNRVYGPQGFTQYQCVLPEGDRPGAAERFLEELSRRGGASFLCVIKDCGEEGEGLLSFPRPGISIAVDLPVRAGTQALVDALNERVIAEGGRIYLAKDRFTRPEHFRAMEGERLERFEEVKKKWDPENRLASAQWARLRG